MPDRPRRALLVTFGNAVGTLRRKCGLSQEDFADRVGPHGPTSPTSRVPSAMSAGLVDGLFWTSLALSPVVAFIVTVPINRWLIAPGLGHAAVHGAHH